MEMMQEQYGCMLQAAISIQSVKVDIVEGVASH